MHIRGQLLQRQPLLPLELKPYAAVVLDPPFAGAPEQVAQIARSQVKRVIYVSCSPAALSRDAAALTFSDWERKTQPGETVIPGGALYRLQLKHGNGAFQLEIPEAGHYLAFEQCGEVPMHILVEGEVVKPHGR